MKVINALGYFTRESEELSPHVANQRTEWLAFNDRRTDISGYLMTSYDTVTREVGQAADTALAYAYIYGDTVHADDGRIAAVQPFGIRERYEAAVALVARIAVVAIGTLNLIRLVESRGLLRLDPATWTRPVVVAETEFVQAIEGLYRAPKGTVPPEPGQEPGPEWRKVTGPEAPGAT